MPSFPIPSATAHVRQSRSAAGAAVRRHPLAILATAAVAFAAFAAFAPVAQAAPIDDAVTRAIQVATIRMHDKTGTKFRNLAAHERGAIGWVVCGELNAVHTFGSYNGYKRFMVLAGSEFLLEGDPRFKGEWARLCDD